MADVLNCKELDDFSKKLIEIASKDAPKDCKRFMKKESQKLKKITKSNANNLVKKTKGSRKNKKSYHNSIKNGKAYKYGDVWAARVYSTSPVAHLLESGHREVLNPRDNSNKAANIGDRYAMKVKPGKGIGKEIGFVPGKHVFEKSKKQFESTFISDIETFIDETIIKKL